MFSPRAYDLCSHRFLATMSGIVSSCRVELKSKQKIIGYSHDINAIFALMGMTCQATHYSSSQSSQLCNTDDYFFAQVVGTYF